jgi:GTPase SAR1 family protein
MKILIMGWPGSGKTTLAEKLFNEVCKNNPAEWINADDVRKECNDWDFSSAGRLRQAKRMRAIADRAVEAGFVTICDFVCPTQELRAIFDADLVIWMDTISAGRYADTNALFEPPTEQEYDIRIDKFDSDSWAETLADLIYMII